MDLADSPSRSLQGIQSSFPRLVNTSSPFDSAFNCIGSRVHSPCSLGCNLSRYHHNGRAATSSPRFLARVPNLDAVCQFSLTVIFTSIWPSSSNAQLYTRGLKKLRIVYTFSLSITALVHVTTIIFATAAYLRPAYLVPPSRPEVSLQSVFLPMSLFSNSKVDQFYEGCLILLQYDMYFACFSALFWAKLILHRSHLKSARCVLVSKALFLSALVGSGGAALALIWERDEKVLGIELRSKDEKSL